MEDREEIGRTCFRAGGGQVDGRYHVVVPESSQPEDNPGQS